MPLTPQLEAAVIRIAAEFNTVRGEVSTTTGDLASLATTDKSSLVAAINEALAAIGSSTTITADDITDATVLGKALIRAADAAAARTALSVYSVAEADSAIATAVAGLADSAPEALNTLNELAAALGDDPNFASQVLAALGNRLRFDTAQTLTGAQQAQGQDNLSVYSRAQIGDPDTDFVAVFESALLD